MYINKCVTSKLIRADIIPCDQRRTFPYTCCRLRYGFDVVRCMLNYYCTNIRYIFGWILNSRQWYFSRPDDLKLVCLTWLQFHINTKIFDCHGIFCLSLCCMYGYYVRKKVVTSLQLCFVYMCVLCMHSTYIYMSFTYVRFVSDARVS